MRKSKPKQSKSYSKNEKKPVSHIRVSRSLEIIRDKNFVQVENENFVHVYGSNRLQVSTRRAIKQVTFKPTVEPHKISRGTMFFAKMMINSPIKELKRIGHDLIDF